MSQHPSHKLLEKEVVVLLGPGGVGKTTCSIALATMAARCGKRVAVLSIDPAKRLASALGIKVGAKLQRVHFPGKNIAGSLDASMLDQKDTFDRMVRTYAPSAEVAEKILQQPLYQSASTRLAGALEYMALSRLQELVEDQDYDFIVLDTPPDHNALDFLSRPNVLANFQEQKVMNWLVKPFHIASRLGFGKLMSFGERLMGGVAKVTGFKALHTFAEFLLLIQEVIEGFHAAGKRVRNTLKSSKSAFLFVGSSNSGGVDIASYFAQQLQDLGYRLDGVVFNRLLSKQIQQELAACEDPSKDPVGFSLQHRHTDEQQSRKNILKSLNKMFTHQLVSYNIEESDVDIDHVDEIYRFCEAFMPKDTN